MGMKTLAARIIRTFGFRNIMMVNAIVSSVFLAACALFTVTTPLLLIMIMLVVGGFFRSLQFTAINTRGLCRGRAGADEPRHHAGQRQPATGDFGRRRRRRVLGGIDHAAAPRAAN